MRPRCVRVFVLLGATGAVVAATAVTSSNARADEPPPLPVPLESFIAPQHLVPQQATPVSAANEGGSQIPGLYNGYHADVTYNFTDADTNESGEYTAHVVNQTFGGWPIPGFPFYTENAENVLDSSGAAPVVGTSWSDSTLGISFMPPVVSQTSFYDDQQLVTPALTAEAFHSVGMAPAAVYETVHYADGSLVSYYWDPSFISNYFSTGPAGTLDELIFFGQYVVPVMDIPAATTAAFASLDAVS